jgi:hypothetical protein
MEVKSKIAEKFVVVKSGLFCEIIFFRVIVVLSLGRHRRPENGRRDQR